MTRSYELVNGGVLRIGKTRLLLEWSRRHAQHRSLEAIGDPEKKAEAGAVRSWFIEEFLHARLD